MVGVTGSPPFHLITYDIVPARGLSPPRNSICSVLSVRFWISISNHMPSVRPMSLTKRTSFDSRFINRLIATLHCNYHLSFPFLSPFFKSTFPFSPPTTSGPTMGFAIVGGLSPPPLKHVVLTPTTLASTPATATSRVQLPTEILTEIIQPVADSKDTTSILRLQRPSRQLYLLTTPILYTEIGTSYQRIKRQFRDLDDIFKPPSLCVPGVVTIDPPNRQRHPIDCNRPTRLVWVLSHVKRFIYRPQKQEDYTEHRKEWIYLLDYLKQLQKRVIQATISDVKLFPSLKHIIVDISRVPVPDFGGYDTRPHWARLPRRQTLAELAQRQQVEDDEEKLLMRMLRLLAGKVSNTHVCLDLGRITWTPELESMLYRLECRSINFHRIRFIDMNILLPVKKIVLDFGFWSAVRRFFGQLSTS